MHKKIPHMDAIMATHATGENYGNMALREIPRTQNPKADNLQKGQHQQECIKPPSYLQQKNLPS